MGEHENPSRDGASEPVAAGWGAAMLGQGNRQEVHAELRAEMEQLSEELRSAILGCRPHELLGFLWGQLLLDRLRDAQNGGHDAAPDGLDDLVFALEYVHAALSSHADGQRAAVDQDAQLHKVLALSTNLRQHALRYSMLAALLTPGSVFGEETGGLALQAMTTWITIRGHRYQGLEQEFFEFVLGPHDEALKQVYDVGAAGIASGIQAAVDATRFGHMRAVEAIASEMDAVEERVQREGIAMEEAVKRQFNDDQACGTATQQAISSLLFGGICNVGESSGLPTTLLDDLAFVRGEETEFFAPGELRGTPLRTMPARVKPLVIVDGEHFACDPNFLRDSAYRAIQRGLLARLPSYREQWRERQTRASEAAFVDIFREQLLGAQIYSTVYYPDSLTGFWAENDALVILDDVLLQVEVKAGVMAMHSPELQFDRHVRAVQDLVVKAHHQCDRFFRYVASAPEVPLFELREGKYVEVIRLRLADYRVVIPIGLTVEAFTPFSSMCKRLEPITPILGKYHFVSMSIDDLFVLTRLLPTAGELMHYLSVRQSIAAIKEVFLHDELDHLGAYIKSNRADQTYREQLSQGATLIMVDRASDPVDAYFGDPAWPSRPPPAQTFPPVLKALLRSMSKARRPSFLAADSTIRDYGGEWRQNLADRIAQLMPSLKQHPVRWFMLMGDEPLMVWLQRTNHGEANGALIAKAEAVALTVRASVCRVLVVFVEGSGEFAGGELRTIAAPERSGTAYNERYADAEKLRRRFEALTPEGAKRIREWGS